ncbi:MAG: hypothetical protein CM1200mP3_07420 [Chloroflexota bacterium]|nr:MAG: hypothetical protein CM1200mP3_07420 [Chloroflexota bacterium]
MYGDRVHEEVIKNGETETGVTIHIVDGGYDSGIVISQEKVAVLEGDSVEDLRRRCRRSSIVCGSKCYEISAKLRKRIYEFT